MGRRFFVLAAFFLLLGVGCFRDEPIPVEGEEVTCVGDACECSPDGCSEGEVTAECGPAEDCTSPSDPCSEASDCPGVSAQCLEVACQDGACVTIAAAPYEPIDRDKRGDCSALVCDPSGNVIDVTDLSDVPDDGNPCTNDLCLKDKGPVNEPFAQGAQCGMDDGANGVCKPGSSGEAPACVECIDGIVNWCASGEACDGIYCVPLHCVNDAYDHALGETAHDCGGPCSPCPIKGECGDGSDCLSGVCTMGICDIAGHFDGVKNAGESGVDCGCQGCPKCPDGQGCGEPSDCESSVCYGGECLKATCSDGVKNQGEAGVDCEGPCALPCD